jgi:RimJ/RimL family protein N-acetyltransferase
MTDLVTRALRAGEESLFLSMDRTGPAGIPTAGLDYGAGVLAGQYRPEWTWVALRGGQVVARAAWWGRPGSDWPLALDWLDCDDDPDAGAAVLQAAPFRCDCHLALPPGWRHHPPVRQAARVRIAAAERAGLRPFIERLHYTWTPAAGLPEQRRRLVFRPEPDDNLVLGILCQIVEHSLDAHERRTAEQDGLDAAAREELATLRQFPAPRHWWLVGCTADEEPAGLAVPSRNHNSAIIAFIGVVPSQRGHGYSYDLLAEATHLLAREGADTIDADTDTTNTPMAATFARAGYPITGERMILAYGTPSQPPGHPTP